MTRTTIDTRFISAPNEQVPLSNPASPLHIGCIGLRALGKSLRNSFLEIPGQISTKLHLSRASAWGIAEAFKQDVLERPNGLVVTT